MAAAVTTIAGAAAPAPPSRAYAPMTVLSPSQARTFKSCSARWYFKYVAQLPDPKTSALALGGAVHEAINFDLHHKAKAGVDLPAEVILDRFDKAWIAALAETELREDESAAELQACGRGLVTKYAVEALPAIHPVAVEMHVDGEIAGVRVQGIIDILEDNGTVRDIKTASRKPSGISDGQAFQLATYVPLVPGATGVVQIDTLVKTKAPQLIRTPHTVTREEVRACEVQYPLIQEAMRAGYYVPNREDSLCSRRNCPFWRACEREFGGHVE